MFVLVLFGTTIIDYVLGRLIARYATKGNVSRLFLWISLLSNVGLLVYFKYANFFVGEFQVLLSSFGFSSSSFVAIALPIGISFFTFQKISYIVDVYRGTTPPAKKFTDFALYIALFPQLIAGPIVRYHDIASQIISRTHSFKKFFSGLWRFSIGLGKKVLIANELSQIVDTVFALPVESIPFTYAWIAILAYAFQIYFDFSGYSDMAIGLSRMIGFDILENFRLPYISRTITEFWRRWHISLSRFMREYLYIPLGGNRVSAVRMYGNLWIVFLLSGFWHGAAWTFVIWGAWHGFFLMCDKMFFKAYAKKISGLITVPLTFFIVSMGWVFFRSETLSYAWGFFNALFNVFSIGTVFSGIAWGEFITHRGLFVLVIALLISFIPAIVPLSKKVIQWISCISPIKKVAFQSVCIVFLLLVSVMAITNDAFHPFIYFRF
jgi:alginate O-acetyltransferase complex protein AlgI